MNTLDQRILAASEDLAALLAAVLAAPVYDDSQRIRVSHLASSVSLEHSHACRTLLAVGMVPSGLVVHRAQYEAAVRAVWSFYAASEPHVGKLGATLAVEAEQEAKHLPLVAEMMVALSTKAPYPAYQALANFKENSWKALNSFVHAGSAKSDAPLSASLNGGFLVCVDYRFNGRLWRNVALHQA